MVFGYEVSIHELIEAEVYVIIVDKSGVFTSRFNRRKNEKYIFLNDNDEYDNFVFNQNQIISVFEINEMLSKVG